MLTGLSDLFLSALRGPLTVTASCLPFVGADAVPVPGWPDGTGLPIINGSVELDTTSRSRRQLSCTIADPDLAPYAVTDLLAIPGLELVTSVIHHYAVGQESCPVGRFHIDTSTAVVSRTAGVSLSQAPDRGGFITDADFTGTYQTGAGADIVGEIGHVLISGLPPGIPNNDLNDLSGVGQICPRTVWTDPSRWTVVGQLEDAAGVEAYFDALGHPTVRKVPTLSDTPVWTVNAGAGGVMIEASRNIGRTLMANGWVVSGQRADGTQPFTVVVTDNNSSSPTYWGGPMGYKPKRYTSALVTSPAVGTGIGVNLLSQSTGISRSVDLTAVPNPALDGSDVIRALYPNGHIEALIIDQMSIPLGPDQPMTMSTRTYTSPATS